MDETQISKLLADALAPLTAKVDALSAENATLKAQAATNAAGVTAIAAERGLEKLLADARGENGGPVKLAAKDAVTEGYLRTVYEAKGAAAATELLATLPTIGKGKAMVSTGNAAGASQRTGARHPLDFVGVAPHAYVGGARAEVYAASLEQLERNGPSKVPVISQFRNAAIEATRRAPTREVEIENA